MREYNRTAIGYPLRRCTLVLNQGRSLPPLFFLTSDTRPLSCTHSTFFLGYGWFSKVCPASPAIQGINLTPLSAEPGTVTTRPLKGSEATTLQVITITSPSNFPPLPNPTSSPANWQHPSHGPTQPKSHWAHPCSVFAAFLPLKVYITLDDPTRHHQEKNSQTPPPIPHVPPARPDELQGLLADSSDNERGETLSSHSNPGGRGRRRGGKRKFKLGANGKPRRITSFGFDLFGRPSIQLPGDDADDALLFRRHRSGSSSTPPITLTTQTFDSDAAP